MIVFLPDYSKSIPVYSDGMLLMTEPGEAFLIAALTLMGLKLADDREVIPAAGFAMSAIAMGIVMVTTYELIGDRHAKENLEKTYQMYVGSNFLFAIGIIMIATYSGFPKWLHYLTISSIFPYLYVSFIFLAGNRNWTFLDEISGISFFMFSIVQILRGIMVWKKRNE
ncbi:MAG: hypothetical protein K1X61_15425 [Chitinophagales bacterium]|nr:hypothetical protein [Chitinophagales bacterium]